MATKIVFHPFPPPASHVGRAGCWNVLRSLALVIGPFFCSTSARAQLQQPFVFAADPANPRGIAVFTRNDSGLSQLRTLPQFLALFCTC